MRRLFIFIAASLLAACSRDKPMDGATSTPPVATEAAPTDAAATPATSPLVFRVMREGGGGLDATINQIDPQGQASFYATVPGSGEAALGKPCESGQRFQAEPKVAAFLRGPTQVCAARVEFMLFSTQATLQFIKRGDDASASGDLLVAQSNYGIAADRLQFAEPGKAQRLRVLSTVAAGRALGVEHPVQGNGGAEQPTAEFKDRVRLFQKDNGIGESGELDGRTRDSIGRMQLRGSKVVVPPANEVPAAPALVVTPQAVTPAIEVRMNATQMLAIPASPQTAAMIHANKRR